MTAETIDYDSLMQANLARVFGEHDASRRMKPSQNSMPTMRYCMNRMRQRRAMSPSARR